MLENYTVYQTSAHDTHSQRDVIISCNSDPLVPCRLIAIGIPEDHHKVTRSKCGIFVSIFYSLKMLLHHFGSRYQKPGARGPKNINSADRFTY